MVRPPNTGAPKNTIILFNILFATICKESDVSDTNRRTIENIIRKASKEVEKKKCHVKDARGEVHEPLVRLQRWDLMQSTPLPLEQLRSLRLTLLLLLPFSFQTSWYF